MQDCLRTEVTSFITLVLQWDSINDREISPTQNQRLDWLDVAKGIAIILVVYGHAARGIEVAGLISFGGAWGYADYLIYTIHMPAFFAASGLVYERSRQKPRDARKFWVDKIVSLTWPYLLWTVIHVSIQTMMSGSGAVNNEARLDRLLSIGWDPVSPFWFLYALFVAFAISFSLKRVPLKIVAGSAFLLMLTVYHFKAPQLVGDLAYGLTYFSLGRLAFAAKAHEVNGARFLLPSAACTFLISTTIAYWLNFPVRLETVGTLAGLVALLLLSKALVKSQLKPCLVLLGGCTMGIYVMHIIVIGAVRVISLKMLHLSAPSVIIGCTVFGVVVPLAVQLIANLIGLAKLLGLRTATGPIGKKWRPSSQTLS